MKRHGILLSAAIESQKVALDRLEAERLVLLDKDAEKRQQIDKMEQELAGLRLSSTSSPQAATLEPAPREESTVATPRQAAQGGRTPRVPTEPKVKGPPMPAEGLMPAVGPEEPNLMPAGQFQEVRSPLCLALSMPEVICRVLAMRINPLNHV